VVTIALGVEQRRRASREVRRTKPTILMGERFNGLLLPCIKGTGGEVLTIPKKIDIGEPNDNLLELFLISKISQMLIF
jgi:hypothetical protein